MGDVSEQRAEWLPPVAPTPAPARGSGGTDSPFEPERQPLLKRIGGAIVAAALLLVKFGKAALLLLPKAKILTTSGSMLVSVAAYSFIWGWQFAVGFVLLLLVHEMGHVIQLRREGIPASAPLFIPFLGAVVGAKSLGDDAAAEARVGLAGPILGTLGAGAVLAVGAATGNDFWYALAFTGFFLNLFNLLPVVPLDGGRAMAAMAPWVWFLGFGAMVVLALTYPNPIILLILVFAALETYRRWKGRKHPEAQAYYKVRPRTRLLVAAVYLGLIALLVLGMDVSHVVRDFSNV
jgi:Zn-dependent protease